MEPKDPGGREPGKNNPIRNLCWPLSGEENEECIISYEGVFEEQQSEEEEGCACSILARACSQVMETGSTLRSALSFSS